MLVISSSYWAREAGLSSAPTGREKEKGPLFSDDETNLEKIDKGGQRPLFLFFNYITCVLRFK